MAALGGARRDVMGRPGKALVTVRDGELTVMVPPGESAVFGVEELEELEWLRSLVGLGTERLRIQRCRR